MKIIAKIIAKIIEIEIDIYKNTKIVKQYNNININSKKH
jgi:hypothetical protein